MLSPLLCEVVLLMNNVEFHPELQAQPVVLSYSSKEACELLLTLAYGLTILSTLILPRLDLSGIMHIPLTLSQNVHHDGPTMKDLVVSSVTQCHALYVSTFLKVVVLQNESLTLRPANVGGKLGQPEYILTGGVPACHRAIPSYSSSLPYGLGQ